MKRAILVHGWDGGPDKDWFPWLRKEIENRGFEVIAPALPDAEEPRKEKWVPALAEAAGAPDSETYFVAHSMGCQTTLRFLETLSENVRIGGALFVAGFIKPLVNLEGPDMYEIAASWTDAPIDFGKVKKHLPKSLILLSDDDPWVTVDNGVAFEEQLGSEILVEPGRRHFNEDEEPSVLAAFEKLVS